MTIKMALPLTFKLPDLITMCTGKLSSSIHPAYLEAGVESAEWASSYEVLGPNSRVFFAKTLLSSLAGCAYPYVGYEELKLCCDYLNFVFALDEVTDVQNGADARKTMDIHIRSFSGEACDGSAMSQMSHGLRSRFFKHFCPSSIHRFMANHIAYTNAVIKEAEQRDRNVLLGLEDYIVFRREIAGVKPCFDLIECCLHFCLPDDVAEHPIVKRMHHAALDLVALSNDVYSYNMEQSRDGHSFANFITVIMKEKGCALQEAVDYAGAHIQGLISQFTDDRAALPSFGAVVDDNLREYIHGLETWVTGNLQYSFITPRYFGDEREEVRRTHVVKLARRNQRPFNPLCAYPLEKLLLNSNSDDPFCTKEKSLLLLSYGRYFAVSLDS
ncbi:terpenoid synthase [Phellopilus nigrolimitatus]|nr:terpenoid synthase [Phellopilus nigrolimitatus]